MRLPKDQPKRPSNLGLVKLPFPKCYFLPELVYWAAQGPSIKFIRAEIVFPMGFSIYNPDKLDKTKSLKIQKKTRGP
jgi:hypothetical protein